MNLNVRSFPEPFLRRLFKSDLQKRSEKRRTQARKFLPQKRYRRVSGKLHIARWLPSSLYHTPVPEQLTRGSHAPKKILTTSLHDIYSPEIHNPITCYSHPRWRNDNTDNIVISCTPKETAVCIHVTDHDLRLRLHYSGSV